MASIGWLHLTDLHFGLTGQKFLWPSVKEQFFRDLALLHAKSGPWDLVCFTGDLTQRGSKEEFDQLTEALARLWEHLAKLGSKPALVTVPGNHDLQRPKLNPTVRALRTWNDDSTLRDEFWSTADNDYRATVNGAFSAYEDFVRAHPLPAEFLVRPGALAGDRSVSLERDGLKVALVGLNSAFLQLEGGDYLRKLDLDSRQLQAVCGVDGDAPQWLADHHVTLLLTHHPTTWLSPRALSGFKADIAPPGRFVAHLFGHMHEGGTNSLMVSGSSPQRSVQGPSLFGLETWGDGAEQRIHGYMAGRISLEGKQATLKFWPRELRKTNAGAWRMVPNHSFDLEDEATTEEFKLNKAAAPGTTRVVTSDAPPVAAVRAAGAPEPTAATPIEISRLSGPQMAEFQRALLSAFPDTDSLAQMTRFHLGENLGAIATGNLRNVVFELILWAQSHGRLGELLVAAVQYNPGNPDLRRFAAPFGLNAPAPVATPGHVAATNPSITNVAAAPVGDAAFARELRTVLSELYSSSANAQRLADDAELNRSRIDFGGSAQTVWFNVLEEARKSGKLGDLIALALVDYPNHADLRRLSRSLAPAAKQGSAASAGGINSSVAYDALTGLLTAQFEEVLFRLAVPTRHLPSQSSSQSERAIALVRLLEGQQRLPELAAAIQKVGGRLG